MAELNLSILWGNTRVVGKIRGENYVFVLFYLQEEMSKIIQTQERIFLGGKRLFGALDIFSPWRSSLSSLRFFSTFALPLGGLVFI